MRLRPGAAVAVVAAMFAATFAAVAPAGPAAAGPLGFVRVDQGGYLPDEPKQAYLMSTAPAPGARFAVVDRWGRTVLNGRAGARLGSWNARYGQVYALDLSALRKPGSYRVRAEGAAVSVPIHVRARSSFHRRAVLASGFFTAQRDGADVPAGRLRRKPAHLNDRRAEVHDWPVFTGPDTDEITGEPRRIGGPVDVEGGWSDAGDFLKFTHTSAFADTLLWAAARDGRRAPALIGEARHGLAWLGKMWDERSKTLYIQVGVGSGNKEGTFVGDHDVWRLPENDDADNEAGHKFLRNRPVFRANAPGELISPNLAGRVTAAFALAAQVEPDRAKARAHLRTAAEIYGRAKTENVGQLVTALPHAFYPEDVWHDDMELGGVELALAARRLGDARARTWLRQAAGWASRYVAGDSGGDTFNLYDTSALAHADLVRALRESPESSLPIDEARLIGDLRTQLGIGTARAAADPFRAGAIHNDFDAVPHTFGLAATALHYRRLTGDARHDAFASAQRGWAFGANAWGTSFMVGVGENFVRCPQHVVANLNGRLDGRPPLLSGAVVNGPNDASLFEDGLGDYSDGMRPCPPDGADRYAEFAGRGSRFVDDVRSWQTSEPALDFTALGAYAMSLFSRRGTPLPATRLPASSSPWRR